MLWIVENNFNSCNSNCADRNFSSKNFYQKGPILSFKASKVHLVHFQSIYAKSLQKLYQVQTRYFFYLTTLIIIVPISNFDGSKLLRYA